MEEHVWRSMGMCGGACVCVEEHGLCGGACVEEHGYVWRSMGMCGGAWVYVEEHEYV